MSTYSSILDSLRRINSESLNIVSDWRSSQKRILDKVNANGVHDVVTEVDLAIEELTKKILEETIPGVQVFGEESFKQDFSITNDSFYIVVDPIDGTKEFIKGSSDWSISICAVKNGTPVVASVYMPDRNELFTCIKGSGVKINDSPLVKTQNNIHKIAVSPRQIKDASVSEIIASSGYHPVEIPALTPKICSLLRGEVSSAVYFKQDGQSTSLWDYAASVLLVSEYGGKMLSLSGSVLPFSGEEVVHRDGWLATDSSEKHKDLLACLQSIDCL